MRNALYFPYISVPSQRWTTHMLLYWDQLSSIVPFDYIENPSLLQPFMRDLVEEGLVTQVVPSHFLRDRDVWTPFIRLLEPRLSDLDGTPAAQAPVQLHFDKMGYELVQFLRKHDLADKAKFPWYRVDVRVANWYMAYLAITLGSLDGVHAAPITDDLRLISSLTRGPVGQPARAVHRAKARSVLLDDLLPVPRNPVDVHKLADFKREHGTLLGQFRLLIEAKVNELARIEDTREREIATMAFQLQTRVEIEEISNAMRPHLGMVTVGSLVGLAAGGLTAATTDMSVPSMASAAAGAALLNAIAQAIGNLHPNKAEMLKRPMAYAVNARLVWGAPAG